MSWGNYDKPPFSWMTLTSPETPDPDDLYDYLKQRTVSDSGQSLYDFCVEQASGNQDVLRVIFRSAYSIRRYAELVERHAETMITGTDLINKWRITEDILRGTVLAELPVYDITPTETFELIDRVPHEFSSHRLWNPAKWWFKRLEVAFYWTLHPEICDPMPEEYSLWIDQQQLAQKWKITPRNLLKLVREYDLPAYLLYKNTGLLRVFPEYIQNYSLKNALFDKSEADNFLDQHPKLYGFKKKKTKAQRGKERDIERIAKMMDKIKNQVPGIIDDKLAEVIHWAFSKPRPFFDEEDKYAWVKPHVDTDHFETAHEESWVRQRIREISKKPRGRPRKS